MYVGNLSFDASEAEVRELFSQHGTVTDIHVPTDRTTGRMRGFAFVTLDTKEGMDAAINALNGQQFMGRALTINEARPREERPSFGGGGGGGGSRGGYGGGGGGGGGYGGAVKPAAQATGGGGYGK